MAGSSAVTKGEDGVDISEGLHQLEATNEPD